MAVSRALLQVFASRMKVSDTVRIHDHIFNHSKTFFNFEMGASDQRRGLTSCS
jgi:hypothetical protein